MDVTHEQVDRQARTIGELREEIASLNRRLADSRAAAEQLRGEREQFKRASISAAQVAEQALERLQRMDVVVKAAQAWANIANIDDSMCQDEAHTALVDVVDAYTAHERTRS